MMKLCLFLCIYGVIKSKAGSASFIKPCIWTDKNCILVSSNIALPYFVKGIPELNIPPPDPIYIKNINASNGDLKLNLKDLKITGMTDSVFLKVERPDADKTILFEFELPVLVTGKYKAGGKIFIVEIEGDGDAGIKCDKIRVNLTIRIKTIENNDKKYYKITGFDYKFEPIERVFFQLTNLYNGDKNKGQVLLDLINQNWKELVYEIGKPVIQEIMTQEISRIKQFFLSVPIDELEISQ